MWLLKKNKKNQPNSPHKSHTLKIEHLTFQFNFKNSGRKKEKQKTWISP